MNHRSSKKTYSIGFTLIEVLVALVILAVALTAVVHATNLNVRNTIYLQNKTIAFWAGEEIMMQIRAGLMSIPDSGEPRTGTIQMLGQTWNFSVQLDPGSTKAIPRVKVAISQGKDRPAIAQVIGFVRALS